MTARAMAFSHRRGACPDLSVPMPTGDGLLVRLLPIGTMPLSAFAGLCRAARTHGNGIIEVTGRGSIQVRGLNAVSAPRFADAIAALDIAVADGLSVLSNGLAGLDPEEIFDANALAADVRHALAGTSLAARLAPKVSVVFDGGGVLDLDTVSADVRLRAEAADSGVALCVAVGGDRASAIPIGMVAPAHGVEVAVRLLEVIARRGRDARARDVLAAEGAAAFGSVLTDLLLPAARFREGAGPEPDSRFRGNKPKAGPIDLYRLRDGSLACGIGLAFGHADAPALERLSQAAAAAGASGVRTAPGRALMIIGLPAETASTFVADAERLGFIVSADDPRRYVVACAGAPMCASAHLATRALAPLVAKVAAASLGPSFNVHISGCAKGCAHAGMAALTAVGTAAGCALIAQGTTRDIPFAMVAADELPAAIAGYARGANREDSHV